MVYFVHIKYDRIRNTYIITGNTTSEAMTGEMRPRGWVLGKEKMTAFSTISFRDAVDYIDKVANFTYVGQDINELFPVSASEPTPQQSKPAPVSPASEPTPQQNKPEPAEVVKPVVHSPIV